MRLPIIVAGLLAVAAVAAGQPVALQIETPSRAQFRMGEEIELKLTFEMNSDAADAGSGRPGWMTMMFQGHGRSVLGIGRNRFVVSPQAGTRDPWEYRLHEGIVYSGPGGMSFGDKTTDVNVDLNQWVRFERPGHYMVYAQCHMTGPGNQDVEMESNRIEIDIVDADAGWQAQELANDVEVLNAMQSKVDSQSFEARMDAAQRITYLDTPGAIREMARRLGTADVQTAQIFAEGLRSSQHGVEAGVALKELLRDPSEPVSPIFLRTLAGLDKTVKDAQSVLAGVIEQKQGAAKAISIKTLLDGMPSEPAPAKLRAEIAGLFQELPAGQQSELLNYQWKKIDGPEMIPVLRQIRESAPSVLRQPRYPEDSLFASAVERLYELDTDRTRGLLIEEMKRRDPRLPYHTLAMLPDATLPELDPILLDNLQHNGGAGQLIARYATHSIFDAVREYYAQRDAEMRSRVTTNPNIAAPACEPALVAYFLRVEPAWGEKVLRETLAERSYTMGRCWLMILGETAVYYSGAAWEKVAIDALGDGAVPVKIDAVRSLGQHGSPDSKEAVMAAFRYWRQWWETHGQPNEENLRLEQAFVEATTRPKNWTPSDSDLAEIHDLCLTTGCRSQAGR